MTIDAADATLSKAKSDVIAHANQIVQDLEKDQKEAEEKANKEAEQQVLEVKK